MRKHIVLFVSIILFCSCSTSVVEEPLGTDATEIEETKKEPPVYDWGGMVIDTQISVLIVDEVFDDRLNPESASYWGEEYINGITCSFLYEGIKIKVPSYPKIISDPSWQTIGYYYIVCDPRGSYIEEDKTFAIIWICYPDGKEDEVKSEIYQNGLQILLDKIWINDELAYQRLYEDVVVESLSTPEESFIVKRPYYNPKYYPWLKPLLDENGNQIGEVPEGYRNVMVLIK